MTYGKYQDMANWLRGRPSLSEYTDRDLSEGIQDLLSALEWHSSQHQRWKKIVLDAQLDGKM